MTEFNVSPLVPEARPIALRAAHIYWQHTQPHFIGLLAHGSALKGGYIPGCSDIDLQLYLRDDAFDAAGNPLLDIGLAIQRDLSEIDPSPFQYIQCYPRRSRLAPKGEGRNIGADIGPVPGTYHVIAGELPVPEATPDELIVRARQTLRKLPPTPPAYIATNLFEYGGGRFERVVRLLCTDVWPTLYCVLVVMTERPLDIWKLPKDAAIAMLPEGERLGDEIKEFNASVRAHHAGERSVGSGLEVIRSGTRFLLGAREWYNSRTAIAGEGE